MNLVCTRCEKPYVERVNPKGLREHLLSRIYVYSFRCQICRHRFHIMQWGVRYGTIPMDRRQYKRRPVDLPVTLRWEYGSHAGMTADLSMGGCSIETAAPVPSGTLVSLQLDAFDLEPPITVGTAIVRSATTWRLGLEFLQMTPEEEERLGRFMLNLWLEGTQMARKGTWEEKQYQEVA